MFQFGIFLLFSSHLSSHCLSRSSNQVLTSQPNRAYADSTIGLEEAFESCIARMAYLSKLKLMTYNRDTSTKCPIVNLTSIALALSLSFPHPLLHFLELRSTRVTTWSSLFAKQIQYPHPSIDTNACRSQAWTTPRAVELSLLHCYERIYCKVGRVEILTCFLW